MDWTETVMDKRGITGAILANEAKFGATHSPKYFTQNIVELKIVAKAQAKITGDIAYKAGQELSLKKRLERPALREKIEQIILKWTEDTSDIEDLLNKDIDEILALYPDEAEIFIEGYTMGVQDADADNKEHEEELRQEGRREEREKKYFEPMNCRQCGSTVAVSVEDNGYILLACRCRSHVIRYTDIKPEWQACWKVKESNGQQTNTGRPDKSK